MAFLAPLAGGLIRNITGAAAINGVPALTRKALQLGFIVTMSGWVVFGLNGRYIAKQQDEGKDRTFDAAAFEFTGIKDASASGSSGSASDVSSSARGTTMDEWITNGIIAVGGSDDANTHAEMRAIIARESNDDPNVVNNWDSNADGFNNSRGLTQMTPWAWTDAENTGMLPRAWHGIGGLDDTNANWRNPEANIGASYLYQVNKYGSVVNRGAY